MWEMWDGKRNAFFSPSRVVTFLPVQKHFVLAVPKCDVFREGCDKKRHMLKKYIFMCESVTFFLEMWQMRRHIFCQRKKWQMRRHSLKSETGSWEEIRLGPTLNTGSRINFSTTLQDPKLEKWVQIFHISRFQALLYLISNSHCFVFGFISPRVSRTGSESRSEPGFMGSLQALALSMPYLTKRRSM